MPSVALSGSSNPGSRSPEFGAADSVTVNACLGQARDGTIQSRLANARKCPLASTSAFCWNVWAEVRDEVGKRARCLSRANFGVRSVGHRQKAGGGAES